MIKQHIPNLITSCNIMCGTGAVMALFYNRIDIAALLMVGGMIFDFFDGLSARALHVKSELGKELDSLADVVSFGVAPAMIAHLLIKWSLWGSFDAVITAAPWWYYICLFSPLLIPAFSAYRLAKFNLDTRQTVSFLGMPTPANAIFWATLVLAFYVKPEYYAIFFNHPWELTFILLVLSILLITELPMFSLKLSKLSYKGNENLFIFLLLLIVSLIILGWFGFVFTIPIYILVSAIGAARRARTKDK